MINSIFYEASPSNIDFFAFLPPVPHERIHVNTKMKLRLFFVIMSANSHIPCILSYKELLIFDTRFKSPRKMNSVAIQGAAYACFENGLRIIQIFQFLVTALGNDCVAQFSF